MTFMTVSLEEEKVRSLLKDILIEMMVDQPDVFHNIMLEALEDAGLIAAIREGEADDLVGRDEINALLSVRK